MIRARRFPSFRAGLGTEIHPTLMACRIRHALVCTTGERAGFGPADEARVGSTDFTVPETAQIELTATSPAAT